MRKVLQSLSISVFVLGVFLACMSAVAYAKSKETDTILLSPFNKSLSVFSFFNEKKEPRKIIYGYLPYWSLNKLEYIQLDKVTDIAYFGAYINADGSFMEYLDDGTLEPGYANWKNNDVLKDFISTATKEGVRVALTVISHQDDISDQFLDCRSCWSNLAENIKKELHRNKIRDLNMNFEYVEYTEEDKAHKYSQLIEYLNREMDKEFGESFVVVATFADSLVKPRVTKIQELSTVADSIFIMAYDFHRPTSDNAGPVAPIDGIGIHAEYDIRTMLRDYLTVSPPNKLILGVPYYGYNWVVENQKQYAKRLEGTDVLGYSQSQTYSGIMDTILETKAQIFWDDLGQSPYITYYSPETGAVREAYFDNAESLKAKYDLVNQNNLKGVGIWALGYDEGYVELWNLLFDEFIN